MNEVANNKKEAVISQKEFEQQVLTTLSEKEFAAPFLEYGIHERDIKRKIVKDSNNLLKKVSKKIEYYEKLNNKLEQDKKTELSLRFSQPDSFSHIFTLIKRWIFSVFLIALIVSIFVFMMSDMSFLEGLNDIYSKWRNILIAMSTGLIIIGGVSTFISWRKFIQDTSSWKLNVEPEIKKLDIEKRTEQLKETKQLLLMDVGSSSIAPFIRTYIASQSQKSTTNELDSFDAPGLSQVLDEIYKVDTESCEKLESKLKSLSGGSIGLTGSRGAGKTTLMKSICDAGNWTIVKNNKEREVLSIMTSAPVQYEARDFILHLFSRLCQRVIELRESEKDKVGSKSDALERQNKQALSEASEKRWNIWKPIYIRVAGYLSLSLGVLSALHLSIEVPESNNIAAKEFDAFIANFAGALGITPSLLVIVGIALILLPFANRRINDFISKLTRQEQSISLPSTNSEDPLVIKAYEHLLSIKFQESYTSGWAGNLKLPIINGGIKESQSHQRQPMTLPEIVDTYCQWVIKLSKRYEILIGIDELDKMESEDKVQQFMNDIKVIFGQPNCFYIISVSQSAMSAFERRGISFRNVFDSSFDDVINVNYLNFSRATELIRRRVVGFPESIAALCYSLSGGLPRDLIRICRDVLELPRRAKTPLQVSELALQIISNDTRQKIKAFEYEASQLTHLKEAVVFLEKIHPFNNNEINKRVLAKGYNDVKNLVVSFEDDKESAFKLEQLSKELSTHMLFGATILEIFTDKLDFPSFDKDVLDDIAKAKQSFNTHSELSRLIILDVRQKLQLTKLDA